MASGHAPTEDVKGVIGGEQGAPPPPRKLRDRLFFADNLRTYLITLVVLHHLAIVYTGGGLLLRGADPDRPTGTRRAGHFYSHQPGLLYGSLVPDFCLFLARIARA
jgi:hypothetical protein